jgi:hypothetical protein
MPGVAAFPVGDITFLSLLFIWTLIILLVPLLGAAIYHIFFADRIHVTVRATMIFGGIFTVILVLIYLGTSI